MKIQVASDLHTEMHHDCGANICDSLTESGGANVLILAGDIAYLNHINDYSYLLARLKSSYDLILVTVGNHEYYKSDFQTVEENRVKIQNMFPSVKFLNRGESYTYNNQRFIGGTGWFPQPSPVEELNKRFMSDFKVIKDFENYVYDLNNIMKKELVKLENDDVLITHHIPKSSIHPKYKYDALNPFFAHGLDDLIFGDNGPKLYVHGHTHEKMDYVLNKTRVVCNPFGYPSELQQQNRFNPALFIEV